MRTPVHSPSHRTPMELYRSGIAALRQQLGPVDSIRFLHLLEYGSGDYTAEPKPKTMNPPWPISAPKSDPPLQVAFPDLPSSQP